MIDEPAAATPRDVDTNLTIFQPQDDQPPPATNGEQPLLIANRASTPHTPLEQLHVTLTNAQEEIRQVENWLATTSPQSTSTTPSSASPWHLPRFQAIFFLMLVLMWGLVVFLRLFKLDSLQTEVFGDIQIVYNYIKSIFAGEWPVRFTLSAGPAYHYAIAPIVAVVGYDYYGLKFASCVVSIGALLATYGLSRRLVDDRFALLATAIAGVSSWLLIFSRLGNSQILVPVLTTGALWLAVRFVEQQRTADVVACAAVSALGLYTYPQSFVLPGVIFVTLLCLRWAGHPVSWKNLLRFVLVTIVCALPFARIVSLDPANFFTGYIGGKIVTESSWISALLTNVGHAILAFHVRGDEIFRGNPNRLPHLDQISGVLFLLGIGYWLMPGRRRWSLVLLVPFILLQIPSVLVLGRPTEVPSASRTLGVAPIAYILVASGIWWLRQLSARLRWRQISPVVAGVLFAGIALLNAQRYFGDYMDGLPYNNTPIGYRLGLLADSLPPKTQVYIVGCCWADEMPEPPYVQLMVARPENIQTLDAGGLTCDQLQFLKQPAMLVWSFRNELPSSGVEQCRAWLPAQLYSSPVGLPIFYAAPLRIDRSVASTGTSPPIQNPGDEQLIYESARLRGQILGVLHSPQDMGEAKDLFDGDVETLMRGESANPMVIELRFASPRPVTSATLDLGAMPHFRVTALVRSAENVTATVTKEFEDESSIPHVEIPLGNGQKNIASVRIEIEDLRSTPSEGFHIHVREIRVK